jgi:hypothetical protein
MNATPAPAAPGTIDWTAVAAGAAASLAIGFSASFLMRPMYATGNLGYGTIVAITLLSSLVADGVGGAVAGFMARRRGALHGALAMVGASAFGLVASVVMMSRYGNLEGFMSVTYWLQWLAYAVLGLVVGTVAGLVAAKVAARSS